MSLAEQIFAADDRVKQKIEIPEWGSPDVYVGMMNGLERDEYERWYEDNRDSYDKVSRDGFRVRVVRLMLVDASGQPVFTKDDEPALAKKSAVVLQRIFDAAFALNKLGAKAVEEAAKN